MSPVVTPLHPSPRPASVQGALALELAPTAQPAAPGVVPGCDLTEVDPLLRRRFEQWAGRLCQVACDVTVGARPATQALRWVTPEVYDDLLRRARRGALSRQARQVRPRVVSVRPGFLDARTAEVAFRVADGARYRAVAARFEEHRGHWRCVALELG